MTNGDSVLHEKFDLSGDSPNTLTSANHKLKVSASWTAKIKASFEAKPQDVKSIPRDYLLIRTPGYISWQHKAAQENPQLELFYQDSVQIPTRPTPVGKQYERDSRKYEHLQSWYLHGVNQSYVENILQKYFKLSIPLDGESSADHWIPYGRVVNIEVEPDVWENRLALFFDGNIGNSVASIRSRVEYYGLNLPFKTLGERYVEIWKAKWSKVEQVEVTSNLGLNEKARVRCHDETIDSDKAIPTSDGNSQRPVVIRGRKRRAALRQIRNGSSTSTLLKPKVLDSHVLKDIPEKPLSTSRGRIKRRERRKRVNEKIQPPENIKDNGSPSQPGIQTGMVKQPLSGRSAVWTYETLETPIKKSHNKVPVKMTVDLNPFKTSDGSKLERPPGQAAEVHVDVPSITFSPVDSIHCQEKKRFHMLSYCNRRIGGVGPEPNKNKDAAQSIEKSPKALDYDIHVADLIDEAGFLSTESNWYSSFVTTVEGNPSFPHILAPGEVFDGPTLQVTTKYQSSESYWHKFAVILCGYEKVDSLRELPYSKGYGWYHSKPDVPFRKNRWGYLDVDETSDNSQCSNWRPAWKFDLLLETSDRCECQWTELPHDLSTCKHMDKNVTGGISWGFFRDVMPTQVLKDPLYFSRCSHEARWRHQLEISSLPESDQRFSMNDSDTDHVPNTGSHVVNRWAYFKRYSDFQHEKDFNSAMYYFLGFSVRKDVKTGFHYLIKAAEGGSVTAKAIYSTLRVSHDFESHITNSTEEDWLYDAATQGSWTALRALKTASIRRHREALQEATLYMLYADRRLSDEKQGIDYRKDIEPYYDLSDIGKLSRAIDDLQKTTLSLKPSIVTHLGALTGEHWKEQTNHEYLFGSLLHFAAMFGFIEAVEFLIECGFDINRTSKSPPFCTPLLCALNRGHVEIAKIILSKGADSDAPLQFKESQTCKSPSPLHLLVNVDDDNIAKDLARVLVRNGADVNYKCSSKYLRNEILSDVPILHGESVTPLRWAIANGKVKLAKTLLVLGAKFAYQKYLFQLNAVPEPPKNRPKGCLLLETPCTDPEILEMYFARARIPGIPTEFSQTPLGLLVSEDDGPHRRIRPGFQDFEDIKEALNLLLDLQPGFEKELMWSAVRHDHIQILQFLVEDLEWNIEMRYRGLSMLQNAILYGRADIAKYLITQGADLLGKTAVRQLTCYHLLMLVKRDDGTDIEIFDLISAAGIDVDARETKRGLTALHIAIRNQKVDLVEALLERRADLCISATDQIDILSQGRSGFLERITTRPRVFSDSLSIMGELLVQFIQDDFYSPKYITEIINLAIQYAPASKPNELFLVDKDNGITLLHFLAMTDAPDAKARSFPEEWHIPEEERKNLTKTSSSKVSLLRFAIQRVSSDLVNYPTRTVIPHYIMLVRHINFIM